MSQSHEAVEWIYNFSLWMPDAFRCLGERKSKFGPSQVVLTRNETIREKLRKLKSDDLANLRPDAIFPLSPDEGRIADEKKKLSEMLMKFDREVLGAR